MSPAAPFPRDLSGARALAVPCRSVGFEHVATKGSHAKVRNGDRIAIIPLHTPLAVGTLRSILRQAAIEPDAFVAAL